VKAIKAKTKASELLVKVNRYNKQRRLALKRIKELSRRENQNILKLKIDEMMTKGIKILKEDKQLSVLKILNFFSPRFSFFIIFVKGEGFTNPFFEFLDFFSKNIEMP
jgi:hypothetical protein